MRPYLHQTISASKISALYITVNLKKAFCVLNFTTNLLPIMQLNCCKNTAILYMNVKKTEFPSFFLHKMNHKIPLNSFINTGTAAEQIIPFKTAIITILPDVYFISIGSVVSSLVAAAGAIAAYPLKYFTTTGMIINEKISRKRLHRNAIVPIFSMQAPSPELQKDCTSQAPTQSSELPVSFPLKQTAHNTSKNASQNNSYWNQ